MTTLFNNRKPLKINDLKNTIVDVVFGGIFQSDFSL